MHLVIGVDLTGILGGRMAGLTLTCCRGKKHIFLHCNASNLVFKILQHDKIWGTIPPLQILPFLFVICCAVIQSRP